jgi:hypothetical protein
VIKNITQKITLKACILYDKIDVFRIDPITYLGGLLILLSLHYTNMSTTTIVASRSLNAWNVFQRLFSQDFPECLEAVNTVYQRLYPSKEAKAAYFAANVARAMALDAKNGKVAVAPVPAVAVVAVAAPAKRAPNGYNAFYGAMTAGQKGLQFGKSGAEISSLWKAMTEDAKKPWKEMAPTWKVLPAEQKAVWVARAQAMRVAKA